MRGAIHVKMSEMRGSGTIVDFEASFVTVLGNKTFSTNVSIMQISKVGGRLKREGLPTCTHNFRWVIDGGK